MPETHNQIRPKRAVLGTHEKDCFSAQQSLLGAAEAEV